MRQDRNSRLQEENLVYLRSWAAATEREIDRVLEVIAPLERRVERLRERLGLISRLADLVEGELRGEGEEESVIDLTEPRSGDDAAEEPRSEPALEGRLRQILDT